MKPHVHSSGTESENNHNILFQSWHKNGECPEGAIPILRTPHSNRRRRSYPTVSRKKQANDFSAPPGHEVTFSFILIFYLLYIISLANFSVCLLILSSIFA